MTKLRFEKLGPLVKVRGCTMQGSKGNTAHIFTKYCLILTIILSLKHFITNLQ